MDMNIFFHDLPQFTLLQFLQTWGLYTVVARFLLGFSDRFIRFMPWVAFWLVATPLRPDFWTDFFLMIACYFLSEIIFLKLSSKKIPHN